MYMYTHTPIAYILIYPTHTRHTHIQFVIYTNRTCILIYPTHTHHTHTHHAYTPHIHTTHTHIHTYAHLAKAVASL